MKRILFFSVGFTIALFVFRVFYTGSSLFFFIPWNLFLAWLPLFFSQLIKIKTPGIAKLMWLVLWLLFLPNAPYIITDLFHLEPRAGVPLYYDLILLFSAAWNGLLMGMVSVKNVETYLRTVFSKVKVKMILFFVFFLSGFGIYLGRYDRYNSWHILTQPVDLVKDIATRILLPWQHLHTWAVTFLFAAVFYLMYETIRHFHFASKTSGL
jgi:uncharacterized membrane protein